jgi:hypothetical protein
VNRFASGVTLAINQTTKQRTFVMKTTDTKNPPYGATETSNEARIYRTNSETEAKIENWIKEHDKDWEYIKSLPIDRLRRVVVLNDIRRSEAIDRAGQEILKAVNDDPKRRQAYDMLTEGMSEEQRENYIIKAEREKRRTQQPAQSQGRRESNGVGV